MTARVLIVDDIATNVRLLEARLTAEYYDVVTASSGQQALDICAADDIDILLLDVMMPHMDGFEVCRRLKADVRTSHIPVVMVTALDQMSDRVTGLEAGADDFLNKPIDDTQLLTRVKSLVRLKVLTDELRARARTGQEIAIEDAARSLDAICSDAGRILLVDTDIRHGEKMISYLSANHDVDLVSEPENVMFRASQGDYELVIVDMSLAGHDALRVCAQLRTLDKTRLVPIVLVADESDRSRVVRGLDMGVNDFIMRPVERHELAARVKTQIRRHRYAVELRESVSSTLQLAVVDDLTGLYNRRYFDRHLNMIFGKAVEQERPLAVMMLDLDYFKKVNDTYGHDAGDVVLKEFALRLQRNIRGIDLACRFGGEEFVVIMPDTERAISEGVAERVRSAIAETPFAIDAGKGIHVTVSVGVASLEPRDRMPEALLKRADIALYRAKNSGRNRVTSDAA